MNNKERMKREHQCSKHYRFKCFVDAFECLCSCTVWRRSQ